MSRTKIINKLKEKNPSINIPDLEDTVDIFSENFKKALKDGKNVELRGFGTFFVKKIKEKFSARNPNTGELIYVPEKNRVRFRPSKKVKKEVNKWKNQ